MTDLDPLLADITRQADEERERILSEARQKVERIQAEADEQVHRLETDAERQMERRLAVERERIEGRRLMAESAARLQARRAAMERVFQETRDRIPALAGGPAYHDVLERLIREALAELNPSRAPAVAADTSGDRPALSAELLVAEQDVAWCRELAGRLGAAVSVRGSGREPATVVVVSADGLRRVDNSLGMRLEKAQRRLEQEVARLLFEEQAADGHG